MTTNNLAQLNGCKWLMSLVNWYDHDNNWLMTIVNVIVNGSCQWFSLYPLNFHNKWKIKTKSKHQFSWLALKDMTRV